VQPVAGGVSYKSPEGLPLSASPPAPFLIDACEVTNRQYAEFVKATSYPRQPKYWSHPRYTADPGAFQDFPVVDLTRADMQAFACWAGKRLPLIEEWMAAAQAYDARPLPWKSEKTEDIPSDMIPSLDMIFTQRSDDDETQTQAYFNYVRPVNASSPESRGTLKLSFMYGNVREMSGSMRLRSGVPVDIIVGAMWGDHPAYSKLTRGLDGRPGYASPHHGFRCVRSVHSSISSKKATTP